MPVVGIEGNNPMAAYLRAPHFILLSRIYSTWCRYFIVRKDQIFASKMFYSQNALLSIRNCWKAENKSCFSLPTRQISSNVWAHLKSLDLLKPRRGQRGRKNRNQVRHKTRITVIVRNEAKASKYLFCRQRKYVENLIYILPSTEVTRPSNRNYQKSLRAHNPYNCVWISSLDPKENVPTRSRYLFVPSILLSNVMSLAPKIDEVRQSIQNANLALITERWFLGGHGWCSW